MLKAVIDANVWVSALISKGKPRQVIENFEQGKFQILYPQELISELEKIPFRPRLAHRISAENLSDVILLNDNLRN